MRDVDLSDPPTDPDAFQRWREAAVRQLETERAAIDQARRVRSPLAQPVVLPVLLAFLVVAVGYLALVLRSSIERIDRRTLNIETALSARPAAGADASAKEPKTEAAPVPDERLADSLSAIKEQVAAIRESIADLQRFASKAKDSAPGGFSPDEMLVAQKGLVVKAAVPGGAAAGAGKWVATPSHDMLDLLLKVPPRRSAHVLTFTPKQSNQVKSIDVYDRNSKGDAGRVADCARDDRVVRCRLKVQGPTILQVVAKTQGDEPLDVELEPGS